MSNQAQRDTVAALIKAECDTYNISSEALLSAADAGLISFNPDGSVFITEQGLSAVKADAQRKATRRAKQSANSRARNNAMKSIGMRRTAYGWE